jgi:hypothetical protein
MIHVHLWKSLYGRPVLHWVDHRLEDARLCNRRARWHLYIGWLEVWGD